MDPGWFAAQQQQQVDRLRQAQMGYAYQQGGRGATGRGRAPRGAGQWFVYGIVWLILAAILAFIILALAR